MKRLTRNLIENSLEAFILSLETINRPSVKYRMEAFCFLFCNAWELLLKAKILNDGHTIFQRKKRGKPRRSIPLDECLDRIFTTSDDPIKLNVRKISEFRNEATHLVIPFVPVDVMGLFQAGVLNFPKAMSNWFGIRLSDRVPLGMMVLVYDFDPKEYSLDHARIKRTLSAETVSWLTEFQKEIKDKAATLGENGQQYYIPVNFKLAIVRNPAKADIVLNAGQVGTQAVVVEVPKEPDKTHPHRQKDIVRIINTEIVSTRPFNSFDMQCINKVYHIRDNPEFCYLPKYYPPQYSDKLLKWILHQLTTIPDFLLTTRNKANIRYAKKKSSIPAN